MTSRASRPAALALAATLLVAGVAACGAPSATGAPATAAVPSGAPVPGGQLASPVVGKLTKLDSQGLTKVTGFRLRLDSGEEVDFSIGLLENGSQFPPGHLAEHMATSSAVKVFFRDEGGAHVVYRLEDGPAS